MSFSWWILANSEWILYCDPIFTDAQSGYYRANSTNSNVVDEFWNTPWGYNWANSTNANLAEDNRERQVATAEPK